MTDARTAALADLWIHIADTGCRDYSPLYDRICRTVAGSDAALALVQQAPPAGHFPNVLLGAVHYLLLGGLDHPLGAVYAGESDADPGPLFVDLCLTHRAEILELLATRHTNTNEVGRSAVLGPALTAVAERLGAPLGLVDVGASAGLNLFCDRYRLEYGAAGATGPADAPVRIECAVAGGEPPIAAALPEIVSRTGLDLDPVDVRDEDGTRWLLACVWPDTGRLPRTRLALDEARKDPPRIIAGDAVDGVADLVLAVPDGATAVVTTTWVLAYLPRARRVAFRQALTAASRERPVAWISAEGPGVVDRFDGIEPPSDAQGMESSVFGLLTFRAGALDTTELLGFVHPHGGWIDWRA
jgi:hypothetical protein